MGIPYLCPVCKNNRCHFQLIFKIGQEIRKDADTGETVFVSDELETLSRAGKPDIDVKCLGCGYVGYEKVFIKAALR